MIMTEINKIAAGSYFIFPDSDTDKKLKITAVR